MSRIIQIIQNFFIRIEGLFGILFKSFANVVKNFFGFFGRLFGFTSSNYFVESNDQVQGIKQAVAKEPTQTVQDKTSETSITERRPNAKKVDNYYLNMARDVKKN
jgi:phage anti-repressor protein